MVLFYALNQLNSTQYDEVRLVLGDQLNAEHSWLGQKRDRVLYLMMEMRQETDYAHHHIQKVLAFFAAMHGFADAISTRHDVLYLTLDHQGNKQNLADNIHMVISHCRANTFSYQAPDEWRLDEQLAGFKADGLSVNMVGSEHFYTQRDALHSYFATSDNLLMENFYRRIRKEQDYLMNKGKPKGGKWNYDHENRKKLPDKVEIPDPLLFANDVTDIYQRVQTQQVATIGEVSFGADEETVLLPWPINRKQSRELLHYFVEHCLPDFGRYQDAMTTRGWSLFHARLSFSMNSKMLSPREVVETALQAHERDPDRINLAQIEGFLRQIIGWREYVRAIYWAKMPDYAHHNQLQHQRKLPEFYWTGKTNMACVSHAVTQSLDHAYAHHIQRLMVTGNFALLAGVDPNEVDAWYLGIYIDAIEWVELPNTRGMSQFAGDGACPFNVLYWHFIDRHRQRFANNHRMSMMYRQWDKRDDEERRAILSTAEEYLISIQEL